MIVRLENRAFFEYESAAFFYLERNPRVASRFVRAVEQALDLIAIHPHIGKPVRHTRRYLVSGFPYAIYYRVALGESIQVISISHQRRRPEFWQVQEPRIAYLVSAIQAQFTSTRSNP